MAKQHKHAGLGLDIRTRLSQEQVAAIVQEITPQARGNLNTPGNARIEQATANRIDLSVRAGVVKRELMTFALTVHPKDGWLNVRVRIATFKTVQQKFLGIPLSPRKLLGLAAYRRFLDLLEDGVLARDRDADTEMVGIV